MVRFNLVITLLLMISIAVKAELTNRMFDVRHVGYAEGLSSQRVFSIVEDGDGAMWSYKNRNRQIQRSYGKEL